MIIVGVDNRPPMLEKSMYDSWKSRIELYMENSENGRMILNSVQNGPLIWPTIVEENGTTRKRSMKNFQLRRSFKLIVILKLPTLFFKEKKYEELSVAKKLQANCDLKATNIVLQGLPPDVYAIFNHHKVAKEIWDRVKLLMQGMKLSLQERKCKLYDEFDKFSFVKGEIRLVVPVFSQRDDPIAYLNKAMVNLSAVAASSFGRNNAGGQTRVVKCYNFQGEGHMDRQCTQPKRPRNVAWFKDKAMLAEALESGQILDEEQLAFLADPGILDGQAA
nr:hypothetical protein [Tanacetum cinerariifolium]